MLDFAPLSVLLGLCVALASAQYVSHMEVKTECGFNTGKKMFCLLLLAELDSNIR